MNTIPSGPTLSQPVSARLPIICEQQLKGEDAKDIHGNYAQRASVVKKNADIQLAAAKQIYVACQCPHTSPGQIVMQLLPVQETLSSSGSVDLLQALSMQMNALTDMIAKWKDITYVDGKSKQKRELPATGSKVLEQILFPITVELALHQPANNRVHAIEAAAYITSHQSSSAALKCTGEYIQPLSHTVVEEHRQVGIQLLGAVSSYLPRSQASSTQVAELCFACDDPNAILRVAAAGVLSQISACVDTRVLSQRVFPLFISLLQDKIWSIRQSALLAAPTQSRSADAMTSARHLLPALVRVVGELGQASKIALASVVTCCASQPVLPPLIPLQLHRFLTSPSMSLYPRLAAVLPAFLSVLVNHPVTALTTERRRVVRGGEHPFFPSNHLPTPTEDVQEESIYTVFYPQAHMELVDSAFTYALPPDIDSRTHNPDDPRCSCLKCYLQILIKVHYRLLVIERPLRIVAGSVDIALLTDTETEQNTAMYTFFNSVGCLLSLVPNPLRLFVLAPVLNALTKLNNSLRKLILPQIGHIICEIPVFSRYMAFLGNRTALQAVQHDYGYEMKHVFGDWTHESNEGLFCREVGDTVCEQDNCRCPVDDALSLSCENFHYYVNDGLVKYYGDALQIPHSFSSEEVAASDARREEIGCVSMNPAKMHLDKASAVFTDITAIACAVPTLASVLVEENGSVPWRAGVIVARQLGLLASAAAGVDAYWGCRGLDTSVMCRTEHPNMTFLNPISACSNSRPPSAVALLITQALYMLSARHTLKMRIETAMHAGPLVSCAVSMAVAECSCVPGADGQYSEDRSTTHGKRCVLDSTSTLCSCLTNPDPAKWHQLSWFLWLQYLRKARKSSCQDTVLTGTHHTRVLLSLISACATYVPPTVYTHFFLLPLVSLLRHDAASVRLEALQILQKLLAAYNVHPSLQGHLNLHAKCLCHHIQEHQQQPVGFVYTKNLPVHQYTCLACQKSPLMYSLATNSTTFECGCTLGCDLQDFNAQSTRCSPQGIAVQMYAPLADEQVDPVVLREHEDHNDDIHEHSVNTSTDNITHKDDPLVEDPDVAISDDADTNAVVDHSNVITGEVDHSVDNLSISGRTDNNSQLHIYTLLDQPNASVLLTLVSLYIERTLDFDAEILFSCHQFDTQSSSSVPTLTQFPPFHTLFQPTRTVGAVKPESQDVACGVGDIVLAHLTHSQKYYDGAESPAPLSPCTLPVHDVFGVSRASAISCGTPKLQTASVTNYTRAAVTLAFGKAPCGCGGSGSYPIALYEYANTPEEVYTGKECLIADMVNAFVSSTIRSDIVELVTWPLQVWVAVHAIAHRHGLTENNIDNLYNVDFIAKKPVNIGNLAFHAFQHERDWYHVLGTEDINEQDTVDIWAQCIYPVVVNSNGDEEDEEPVVQAHVRASRANSRTTQQPIDDEATQKDILRDIQSIEQQTYHDMESIPDVVLDEPLDVMPPQQSTPE